MVSVNEIVDVKNIGLSYALEEFFMAHTAIFFRVTYVTPSLEIFSTVAHPNSIQLDTKQEVIQIDTGIGRQLTSRGSLAAHDEGEPEAYMASVHWR
ncbi:hypothetical protein Plhal304r1_c062g0149761 [Plasmopara halstedii]